MNNCDNSVHQNKSSKQCNLIDNKAKRAQLLKDNVTLFLRTLVNLKKN